MAEKPITLETYRRYIAEQHNTEQIPLMGSASGQTPVQRGGAVTGSQISAAAYNRAQPIIASITDASIRNTLNGHMRIMSKYQWLSMITTPSFPLMKTNSGTVFNIVQAIIGDEFQHIRNANGGLKKY